MLVVSEKIKNDYGKLLIQRGIPLNTNNFYQKYHPFQKSTAGDTMYVPVPISHVFSPLFYLGIILGSFLFIF